MARRSVWGVAVLFFAGSVKSLDAPPPELLENLDFFKSMDLLMENEQAAPNEGKGKGRPGKEPRHETKKPR